MGKDCGVCKKTHASTHRCLDCQDDFCSTAAGIHRRQKATSDHRLYTLAELANTPELSTEMCALHNKQFEKFDKCCMIAVCSDCLLTKPEHTYITLDSAVKKFKCHVEKFQYNSKELLAKVTEAKTKIELDSATLKMHYASEVEKTKKRFAELYEDLITQKNCILQELEKKELENNHILSNQLNTFEEFHVDIKKVSSRVRAFLRHGDHIQFAQALSEISKLNNPPKVSSIKDPLSYVNFKCNIMENIVSIVTYKSLCTRSTFLESKTSDIRPFYENLIQLKVNLRDINGHLFKDNVKFDVRVFNCTVCSRDIASEIEIQQDGAGDGIKDILFMLPSLPRYNIVEVRHEGKEINGSPLEVSTFWDLELKPLTYPKLLISFPLTGKYAFTIKLYDREATCLGLYPDLGRSKEYPSITRLLWLTFGGSDEENDFKDLDDNVNEVSFEKLPYKGSDKIECFIDIPKGQCRIDEKRVSINGPIRLSLGYTDRQVDPCSIQIELIDCDQGGNRLNMFNFLANKY